METTKQKIDRERGEYTWARKKKFDYLKHTGQYYGPKSMKRIRIMPRIDPIVKNLKWWQRIYVAIVLMIRRLRRKIKR